MISVFFVLGTSSCIAGVLMRVVRANSKNAQKRKQSSILMGLGLVAVFISLMTTMFVYSEIADYQQVKNELAIHKEAEKAIRSKYEDERVTFFEIQKNLARIETLEDELKRIKKIRWIIVFEVGT